MRTCESARTNAGSSWRRTVSSETVLNSAAFHVGELKAQSYGSLSLVRTGANCRKSPVVITWHPPKGSSRPRNRRNRNSTNLLPSGQHADFVYDQHFAGAHSVEPGLDGAALVLFQLS
jgi:hypothetical protein